MYKDFNNKAFYKLFGVSGYYFSIVGTFENSDNINGLLAEFNIFVRYKSIILRRLFYEN